MSLATKDKRLNSCKKCLTKKHVWLFFQKYDPHWWVKCKKCGSQTSGIDCAVEELVIKEWNTKNKLKSSLDKVDYGDWYISNL